MKKIILLVLVGVLLLSNTASANAPTTIQKANEYRYITFSQGQRVYFTQKSESVNGAFIIEKGTNATISEVRDWLGYNDYNVLLRFESYTDVYGNTYTDGYQWFRQVDIEILVD